MRPKGLLTTFSIAMVLFSCAGAPQKPAIELGVIDYPAGEVIENMTGGTSFKKIDSIDKATYQNLSRAIKSGGNRVPLASYDRAIAIRPDWWAIWIGYVHSLERYISNHCGQ